MSQETIIDCDTHGKEPWALTVICIGCRRVYQIVSEGEAWKPLCEGAEPAPEICACGANLAGDTARAICGQCYVKEVTSHAPRVH